MAEATMTRAAETSRYTSVAIALHWAIAALIIGQIVGGIVMTNLADSPAKFDLYQFHKTFGLLVLLASLARLAWRIMNPPPASVPMPAWQKVCAEAVHYAFYAIMIAIPLTGWLMVSASPRGVPTLLFNAAALPWPHLPFFHGLDEHGGEAVEALFKQAHTVLAFLTVGLLALHVGAALKHQFVERDGLLTRMAPGAAGGAGRGLTVALAVALLPLALGLSAARLGATAGDGGATLQDAPAAAGANAWAVDYDTSTLAFTLAYQGRELTGAINDWTAAITFDAKALETSSALVRLNARSLATGDGFVDGLIPGSDGLQAEEHPEATFEVTAFRALGDDAYEADADISLRGVTQSAVFPFTLVLTGDEARMTGRLVFDRFDFDLGRINDPNSAYLAPEVTVEADVRARRVQ